MMMLLLFGCYFSEAFCSPMWTTSRSLQLHHLIRSFQLQANRHREAWPCCDRSNEESLLSPHDDADCLMANELILAARLQLVTWLKCRFFFFSFVGLLLCAKVDRIVAIKTDEWDGRALFFVGIYIQIDEAAYEMAVNFLRSITLTHHDHDAAYWTDNYVAKQEVTTCYAWLKSH